MPTGGCGKPATRSEANELNATYRPFAEICGLEALWLLIPPPRAGLARVRSVMPWGGGAVTVTVAVLVSTSPAAFLARNRNCAPLSACWRTAVKKQFTWSPLTMISMLFVQVPVHRCRYAIIGRDPPNATHSVAG